MPPAAEPAKPKPAEPAKAKKGTNIVVLAVVIVFWYGLNIHYNLYNKKILNVFDFPYTCALTQLGAGLLYIVPKYLFFSKLPTFSAAKVAVVSGFHGGGHFATVMSLGAGSVAFANVVKSGEPFVFVLVGILMGQGIPKAMECAALVPIIAGVAIASMAEPEFSALAFGCAMLSNFLFGGRATFAKALMKSDKNPAGMSGSDLFAMNTVFAFLLMAPITFVLEGKTIKAGFDKLCTGKPADLDYMALANGVLEPAKGKALGPTPEYFIAYQLVCGLYYYFYNELAFVVLDMLDAVSQAVANTVKRVVVIIAGTIIFAKPMTTNGIVGSSVAIAGVLLYSLVKSGAFDKKKVEAKPEAKKA